MAAPKLELFWDVGSPYSYLAFTQLPQLRQRTGAEVVLRPFLLGGVFKATGNVTPATNPHKARYLDQDLRRWRQHYAVPMRVPSEGTPFPVNTVLPMRAATAAAREAAGESFAAALFEAYWVHGADVSAVEAVAGVAERVGLDADSLVAAAQTQAIKDELRRTSDEAVSRGAFGAPTFFVGDEMFWGNDRLPFIEATLRAAGGP